MRPEEVEKTRTPSGPNIPVAKSTKKVVYVFQVPILVSARSKAYVCDRSLAGIAGSNPAGRKDVCLLWVFKLSESRRRPTSCQGVLQIVVCVCVLLSVIRCNNNPLHLQWIGRGFSKKKIKKESPYSFKYRWPKRYCHPNNSCTSKAVPIHDL
jgi:hypothetical protein